MVRLDELESNLHDLIAALPEMLDYLFWGATATGGGDKGRFQQVFGIDDVKQTHLWDAVMVMYDYGIRGVSTRVDDLDLRTAAEFILGLQALNPVLEQLADEVPASVLKVVQIASARCVLDGSSRLIPAEPDIGADVLTIPEVALLAGLDVRTVRNVVQLPGKSKSGANGLIAVHQGKRTVVPVDNARSWLDQRSGVQKLSKELLPAEHVELSTRTVEALILACQNEGVTPEEWLRRQLANGAKP